MIFTSKKEVLERMGMLIEEDQHGNAAKLAALSTKALDRSSTTAKAVSAAGGVLSTAAPRRVDRNDMTASRSAPAALHDAYLSALRERSQR